VFSAWLSGTGCAWFEGGRACVQFASKSAPDRVEDLAAAGGVRRQQMAVVVLDHDHAYAHELGEEPAVVGVDPKPGGEGVAKRVWTACVDARGFQGGVPVALAPVAEVEVADPRCGEDEARVRVLVAFTVKGCQGNGRDRNGANRAGGRAGELL
jgi:hypothetical protein